MVEKDDPKGMRKGLTRYGDDEFALFLRKSFIKELAMVMSAGSTVIGIADTAMILTLAMGILKTDCAGSCRCFGSGGIADGISDDQFA